MSYVNMWPKGLSNPEQKQSSKRSADENSDCAGGNMEDMRGRHPMFKMPQWFSEDETMGNFGRRAQPPNWSEFARRQGGPWRERRSSGGSGMSAGEDEVDSHQGHMIPIRIEAEAPPGYEPQQTQETAPAEDGFEPKMKIGNQPAYASKTTTAVDTCKEEVPRDARSSSAPPDMNNAENSPGGNNGKGQGFNNVAKPFTGKVGDKHPPIQEEPKESDASNINVNQQNPQQNYQQPPHQNYQQHPQQNYPPQGFQQPHPQGFQQSPPQGFQQPPQQDLQQPPQGFYQPPPQGFQQSPRMTRGQKSSVIRNIPIMVEGRDEPMQDEPRSPRRTNAATQPQPSVPHSAQQPPQPQAQNWQKPYSNVPPEFAQEPMFHDPFFNFPGSPTMARQQQQHPGPFAQQSPPTKQFHQQQRPSQPMPQQPQPSQAPPAKPQEQPQNVPTKAPEQPAKPQEPPKDFKMEKIKAVRASLTEYQDQVGKFSGNEKNKEFLYLDEMLTRCLLELDNIDPDGRDDVRQSRKTLIKDITGTISLLETKITKSDSKEKTEPMDVDESTTETDSKVEEITPPTENVPESQKSESDDKMNVDEKKSENSTQPSDNAQEETAQKKAKTTKST